MITSDQFEKSKQFIYRHGDLLTRRRFAYHFEAGSRQAALGALACYQNEDGGFGNGLELDVLCPASSGICTEVGLGYLLELGLSEGPILQRAIEWVRASAAADGDVPHPVEAVKAYPHGPWWEQDKGRILSIAGLLGRIGRLDSDIAARADAFFDKTYSASLGEIAVYSYPLALYLRHGDRSGRHQEARKSLEAEFPKMLAKDAWHHPLFFCHNRWDSPDISRSLWQSEAARVLTTLQADGGVAIERYAQLPWWRPVWTLDMLVVMKDKGLLADP